VEGGHKERSSELVVDLVKRSIQEGMMKSPMDEEDEEVVDK